MHQILDVVIKSNTELEYKLMKRDNERLRNEYHLIIEQKEAELRSGAKAKEEVRKVRKFEYFVDELEKDLQLSTLSNK